MPIRALSKPQSRNFATLSSGEDAEAIKAKSEAVAQAQMKLGEQLYAAQQAEAGDGGSEDAPTGETDDDVVDADFEEVDEDDDEKKSA